MNFFQDKQGEKTPAPPIEGVDANGQVMRLRDHAGKVVLLSFWHSQCPPCRMLFDHERELVRRFAGKPFVLVGVNTDSSPAELQYMQQKSGLTWVSWWDGPAGPIARAYAVDRFPALFLIDQQGLVRLRQFGIPEAGVLEKKIEELLAEGSKSTNKI